MQLKIIFAIISTIIGFLSFLPYLRDIFLKRTKPHSYTWLIWVITQGIAFAGLIHGGGGIGGMELVVGTILIFVVFIFSLKFGTRNITRSDGAALVAALVAIGIWLLLENPQMSVLMVCIIDGIGYIPSFRKSYEEPWTETVTTWIGFVIGNCFALMALQQYNFLTMSYLIMISIANLALALICLWRRKTIPKPQH